MSEVMDFLWYSTFTLLWCFVFFSLLAYRAGKDKIFLYYAAYVFFLLLYIGSRGTYLYPFESLGETALLVKKLFNWNIQVIYHCIHMFFGIYIVGIDTKYPKLYRNLKRYSIISVSVGTLIPILVLIGLFNSAFYDAYFVYIHIPIFITVAIIILVKAWKEKDFVISCFFWGTLIYAVLAALALSLTVLIKNETIPMIIVPMSLFYIGVMTEAIAFAIGLGFRLQNVYKEKLQYQKDLNDVQAKLQERLEEKIKVQELENIQLLRQKEKQELETQLAQLQNKVLRSQMNSHFIFNVLNSIKAFIIDNNSKDAVNYLNKFSKFIRKVLDSNFYEENTLEEELKTIQLYLDIENMRFHDKFNYEITIDEAIDLSNIRFPALLMQPFVENAIWHGLMPNKKEKNLLIRVAKKDLSLLITIDDNGIGYQTSITTKTGTEEHKSFGLSIVKDRIKEFNQRNAAQISTCIVDKSTLQLQGTRVEIVVELGY
jgi:sensor histidine kinase YesM